MKENKPFIKILGNIFIFCLCMYLIVTGQRNTGPVKWVSNMLNIDNIRLIGLCIMIVAILGLLGLIYNYNKKYQ